MKGGKLIDFKSVVELECYYLAPEFLFLFSPFQGADTFPVWASRAPCSGHLFLIQPRSLFHQQEQEQISHSQTSQLDSGGVWSLGARLNSIKGRLNQRQREASPWTRPAVFPDFSVTQAKNSFLWLKPIWRLLRTWEHHLEKA